MHRLQDPRRDQGEAGAGLITTSHPYVGRFAPSPTGPLHAGSLVAALASFLDARQAGGQWLLRIDDIDPPRAVEGSVEAILAALEAHQLRFDGATQFQSHHSARYDRALEQLTAGGLTFRCRCTRATLAPGSICVSDCQHQPIADDETASIRIRVPDDDIEQFDDLVMGPQSMALGATIPNFILRRRDGLYAYQLACAVDDTAPDLNHVIRGADLLESTHRQIFIQRCLGLTSPRYGHLPVLTDPEGVKLSKQTGAPALDLSRAYQNVQTTLALLGQPVPDTSGNLTALLTQAIAQWDRDRIPR